LMMKGVEKDLVASTLETAYEDVDEVALARQYVARKRMKQPNAQKETLRVMNRLMRAGFSSNAIFKLLRTWEVPEEALVAMSEGGADSDSYAEREERAGDSDSYVRQNEDGGEDE
jgi:regulatory protein